MGSGHVWYGRRTSFLLGRAFLIRQRAATAAGVDLRPAGIGFWLGTIVMGLVLWLLIVVGALFLVGIIGSPATAADAVSAEASLPEADVAGADIADLPRMAGSMRVEYREFLEGQWAVTEVDYVADAAMRDVQGYYRQAFLDNGWNLLSVDSSGAESVYGITSGMRVGVVEVGEVDGFVNVGVELRRVVAPSKVVDATVK